MIWHVFVNDTNQKYDLLDQIHSDDLTGNELWDQEFEDDFWPLAYKKVGVGRARESYRTARKKADKSIILASWVWVNEVHYPKKHQADGHKEYICAPSVWLNQERWMDEDVLEALNKDQGQQEELSSLQQIGRQRKRLDRLGKLPLEWERQTGCTLASELSAEQQQLYLEDLQQEPDPPKLVFTGPPRQIHIPIPGQSPAERRSA